MDVVPPPPPPRCEQTESCENSTFPILRMRAVIIYYLYYFLQPVSMAVRSPSYYMVDHYDCIRLRKHAFLCYWVIFSMKKFGLLLSDDDYLVDVHHGDK